MVEGADEAALEAVAFCVALGEEVEGVGVVYLEFDRWRKRKPEGVEGKGEGWFGEDCGEVKVGFFETAAGTVDGLERLFAIEPKLIRSYPHHRSVFTVEGFAEVVHTPVAGVVGVPYVGEGGEPGAGDAGERVEVESVYRDNEDGDYCRDQEEEEGLEEDA